MMSAMKWGDLVLPVSIGSSLLCHLWLPILKSFFFKIKKPLHLLNQLINDFLFLILTQITELELVHALEGSLYLTSQINSFQIISKWKISHFIPVIDKQIKIALSAKKQKFLAANLREFTDT